MVMVGVHGYGNLGYLGGYHLPYTISLLGHSSLVSDCLVGSRPLLSFTTQRLSWGG